MKFNGYSLADNLYSYLHGFVKESVLSRRAFNFSPNYFLDMRTLKEIENGFFNFSFDFGFMSENQS